MNMRSPGGRRLVLTLQWLISLGALAYALAGADVLRLWEALRSYAFLPMLAVFGVAALDYAGMSLRLRWLLPPGVRYGQSLRAVVLCAGYNNILPAKAGDALKVVYLTRTTGHSLLTVGSAILWERLMDVLVLLCVAMLAYASGTGQGPLLPAALALGGAAAFWICRRWSPCFHAAYARLPSRRLASILSGAHARLVDAVSLPWFLRAFVLSLCIWCCYFASFALSLCLVAGLELTLAQILAVFAVTCLGMAVPSSPGGLGVFEGAVVLSLSWAGVDRNTALGVALFIHAVHFIPLAVAAVSLNNCGDLLTREAGTSHR